MGINYTDIAVTDLVISTTFNDRFDELDQAIKKNNYSGTAAPTTGDDSADGYTVGSRWIDTTNDRVYVAVDVTVGAAIWLETGAAGLVQRLSAMNFYLVVATPAQGNLGNRVATWRLDDTTQENIATSFPYTGWKSGTSIQVEAYWAMESATSGNVVAGVVVAAVADGEDISVAGGEVSNTPTTAVPGTAKMVKKVTHTVAVTYAPADVVRVSFFRSAASGSDTATGDLHFIAMTVRFL